MEEVDREPEYYPLINAIVQYAIEQGGTVKTYYCAPKANKEASFGHIAVTEICTPLPVMPGQEPECFCYQSTGMSTATDSALSLISKLVTDS